MESVRDLARDQPWRESLERSRERRARSRRSSVTRERPRPRPAGAPARERRRAHAPAAARGPRRERVAKRRRLLARAASAIALLLLSAIPASALNDQSAPSFSRAAHADAGQAARAYANARQLVPSFAAAVTPRRVCPQVDHSTGYANPLAGAKVKPERIDQGVDYAGSGTLSAIGAARITHLATYGSGWPGAFIEYRLLDGPDAGCYVFYAEGVVPARGLRVGSRIGAGQLVATLIRDYGTGFEIGWGAGVDTRTYAAFTHQWSSADDQHNVASAPGKNFSALVKSLGGPPGKVEGQRG